MSNIRNLLGGNVRRLRTEKGWTQSKLADQVDISATFMMHIEHGSRGASLETIELLAQALEVDVSALFLRPGERKDDIVHSRAYLEKKLMSNLSETVKFFFDDACILSL